VAIGRYIVSHGKWIIGFVCEGPLGLRAKKMTKREIIDQIRQLNPTAQADFLASFSDEDLVAYLQQLRDLEREHQLHAAQEPAMSF